MITHKKQIFCLDEKSQWFDVDIFWCITDPGTERTRHRVGLLYEEQEEEKDEDQELRLVSADCRPELWAIKVLEGWGVVKVDGAMGAQEKFK